MIAVACDEPPGSGTAPARMPDGDELIGGGMIAVACDELPGSGTAPARMPEGDEPIGGMIAVGWDEPPGRGTDGLRSPEPEELTGGTSVVAVSLELPGRGTARDEGGGTFDRSPDGDELPGIPRRPGGAGIDIVG
jgi:hypothetical protein